MIEPLNKKILWIEDDYNVIDGLLRPLERAGATVEKARTLRDALTALTGGEYDLLLLDVFIPSGDAADDRMDSGLTLLDEIGARAITTPIVVLTVLTRDDLAEAALARGTELGRLNIAAVVRKRGVRPSELCLTLTQVLLGAVR